MKIFKTLLSSILVSSLLFTNTVFAETTPAFSLNFNELKNTSGQKFWFEMKPGSTAEDSFIVSNFSEDKTITLTPDIMLADDYGPSIPDEWLNIPLADIELKPLESKIVPFSVEIPIDATPGQYGDILSVILTKYSGQNTGGSIQIKLAAGKFLVVKVLPPETSKIPNFSIDGDDLHFVLSEKETATGEMKINNISADIDTTFKVSAAKANMPDFQFPYSEIPEAWLLIDTSNVEISANSSKKIDFTLNIPENANPGHYISELSVEPLGFENAAVKSKKIFLEILPPATLPETVEPIKTDADPKLVAQLQKCLTSKYKYSKACTVQKRDDQKDHIKKYLTKRSYSMKR